MESKGDSLVKIRDQAVVNKNIYIYAGNFDRSIRTIGEVPLNLIV